MLSKTHYTSYSVHLGETKMYKDLKEKFQWTGMKRELAVFVTKCLICQKIKAEHQWPGSELQPIEIPEQKWDQIVRDFVVSLTKTTKGHDAIWIIID